MAWDRTNKLNAIIQEKVAQIVLFRLKDPRMGLVTITRAKLSPDRSECHVYYSVLGSAGQRSATQHALDDARGHIQTEIARTLNIRHTPHLRFLFDESIEGSIRVAALLKTLNTESPPASGEQPASGDEATEVEAPGEDASSDDDEDEDEDEDEASEDEDDDPGEDDEPDEDDEPGEDDEPDEDDEGEPPEPRPT